MHVLGAARCSQHSCIARVRAPCVLAPTSAIHIPPQLINGEAAQGSEAQAEHSTGAVNAEVRAGAPPSWASDHRHPPPVARHLHPAVTLCVGHAGATFRTRCGRVCRLLTRCVGARRTSRRVCIPCLCKRACAVTAGNNSNADATTTTQLPSQHTRNCGHSTTPVTAHTQLRSQLYTTTATAVHNHGHSWQQIRSAGSAWVCWWGPPGSAWACWWGPAAAGVKRARALAKRARALVTPPLARPLPSLRIAQPPQLQTSKMRWEGFRSWASPRPPRSRL